MKLTRICKEWKNHPGICSLKTFRPSNKCVLESSHGSGYQSRFSYEMSNVYIFCIISVEEKKHGVNGCKRRILMVIMYLLVI